jgi:hypothetical protein
MTFPRTNVRLGDRHGSAGPDDYALFVREYRFANGHNVLYEVHGCLQEVAWFAKVLRHHYPNVITGAVKREGIGWFSFKASRPLAGGQQDVAV